MLFFPVVPGLAGVVGLLKGVDSLGVGYVFKEKSNTMLQEFTSGESYI